MARRSIALLAAAGAACVALAGCFASGPLRPDARAMAAYPQVVADFGRYDRFPEEVAGYHRVEVVTYAPGFADWSIGYNHADATLFNAVTLFFYPRMNDTAAQLDHEEQEVVQRHRAARIVGRRTITLMRYGAPYEAHVVDFQYDENFAGAVQPVASELLVVFRAQGVFKVRSTAPLAQSELAQAAMLKLLEGVAWDAPEAFDGQ